MLPSAVLALAALIAPAISPPPSLASSPPSVAARGKQEVTLPVEVAGMYRITVDSTAGTALTLVDQLRGPFRSGGVVGSSNGSFDELLDPGVYKVRLESPAKGKGQASIRIARFAERNPVVPRLEEGRSAVADLPSGSQASFGFRMEKRGAAILHVVGRTAGQVRIWRTGQWIEPMEEAEGTRAPVPGSPVYDGWWSVVLDPGDYQAVAYGTQAKPWGAAPASDPVSVTWGLPEFSSDGVERETLPAGGFAAWRVAAGNWVAALSSPGSVSAAPIQLAWASLSTPGTRGLASCSLAPSKSRDCTAVIQSEAGSMLVVEGRPGTLVEVRISPKVDSTLLHDGEVSALPAGRITFDVDAGGDRLVEVTSLDPDADAAPIGCVLRRTADAPKAEPEVIATDSVILDDRGIDQSFNYDGREESIWFRVKSPATYRFETLGKLGSACELFSLEGDDRTHLSPTSDKSGCSEKRILTPGFYELRLYQGRAGIEHLKIEGPSGGAGPRSKVACVFPKLALRPGHYEVELSTRRPARFVQWVDRPLPLTLDRPLRLAVAKGEGLHLALGGGKAEVRGPLGGFTCASAGKALRLEGGVCTVDDSAAGLDLAGSGDVVELSVRRPVAPAEPRALAPFRSQDKVLPHLELEATSWLDLGDGERRSLTFTVKEPGLYQLTTLGLLATSCELRTPVVARLASDASGGRGRNCLVSAYLRPGLYLASISTVSPSRGHLGVVLSRRAAVEGPAVEVEGEAFFRVPKQVLTSERLHVKKGGLLKLATTAQGASLSCRLEDAAGWPVVASPARCDARLRLDAGDYLWKQLPLSVPSLRHTRLTRAQPPQLFTGNKPRPLALNVEYRARLSKRGHDAYTFDLQAPLDLGITLTDGMMGTLEELLPGGKTRAVEVIAPQGGGPVEPTSGESTEVSATESAAEAAPAEDTPPSDVEGEEPPEPDASNPGPSEPPAQLALATRHIGGQKIHLEPGRYRIQARHSRGDVAITYRVEVESLQVAPGMSVALAAPGRVVLRMAKEGILRLRTRGDTDVRCRVFDARGTRVQLESSSDGDDWNCALAEPLGAGDHPLVIESETLKPGPTELELELAALKPLSELTTGQVLEPGRDVIEVPVATSEAEVRQVVLHSDQLFSCAAVDASGAVLYRQTQVHACPVLLSPGRDPIRLRIWTLDPPAKISVQVSARPVVARSGGEISAGGAVKATIESPGTYRTSEGVLCGRSDRPGVLAGCGPTASLSPGGWVFSTFSAESVDLPIEEVVVALEKPKKQRIAVTAIPSWQRTKTDDASIHVLSATARPGSAIEPSCNIQGGAAVLSRGSCWAVSSPTRESVSSLWAPGVEVSPEGAAEGLVDAERSAFKIPGSSVTLGPGPQTLTLDESHSVKIDLPERPSRVHLTLAPGAWAVAVDAHGVTRDLCPPDPALAACELEAAGGSILIDSPGEARVLAERVELAGELPAFDLAHPFEQVESGPGTLRFPIAKAARDRALVADRAEACALKLDEGTRIWSCSATIPTGRSAMLVVRHGAGPLRVALAEPGGEDRARADLAAPGPVEALPPAQQLALSGGTLTRSLHLDRATVIHLSSTAGTCALFGGGSLLEVQGMDVGCDLRRLLEPGDYAFAVRPFGRSTLSGTVAWQPEELQDLGEGVASDVWLPGGAEHLFRFSTSAPGQVGIGLQVDADVLACQVLDLQQRVIGSGCQQLVSLAKGTWLLSVASPPGSNPIRFRPVLLGLSGTRMDIPQDYLSDFFARINPAAAAPPSSDTGDDETGGGE